MLVLRLHRLERIDQLTRLKATGPPPKLARRLGISTATLYRDIEYLKELGAPIQYCPYRKSYVYKEAGRFVVGFFKGE